jgi:large subunit ribosomal protein L47
MQAIQDTLLERHNAWEEACRLAAEDPDIDLERTDGPQWQPREDHVRDAIQYI